MTFCYTKFDQIFKNNKKVFIACTISVDAGISYGLRSKISGIEKVQEWVAVAKEVKAYTIYGFENFRDSLYPNYNIISVIMIAGNESEA